MTGEAPPPRVELASGYDICPIIIGCWQLSEGHGGSFDRQRALDRLLGLAAAGFDTFDLADIYTGVETLLGDLIRRAAGNSMVPRIRIHTKCVPNLHDLASLRRQDLESLVDRSLRRLGVEALDLVQLHWWDFEVQGWLEAARWLADMRRAGKIRRIGMTNFDLGHLRQIVEAGVPVVSNQVQYSLLDRRPERSLTAFCAEHGIGLLAYGSIAGGFLTDFWLDRGAPEGHLANRSLEKYELIVDEVGGWETLQYLLEILSPIADHHRVGIAEVATRWVLGRPAVAGVIVGLSRVDRTEQYRRALAVDLDDRDRERLDGALERIGTVPGDVYGVERIRGGRHATIMKMNLNRSAQGRSSPG